jgi:predicted  nucleic acid-binding Zn-ribbon protein
VTEAGTETNDETGTKTTALDGTTEINENETDDGTFSHEMITADGDEAIVIKKLDGTDETSVSGTTTGETHDDGTTTVAGT